MPNLPPVPASPGAPPRAPYDIDAGGACAGDSRAGRTERPIGALIGGRR